MNFPRILSRKQIRISPWMDLIEKSVQFDPHRDPEVYHCITQDPYVGLFVQVSDGRIPIVRQYRPCVEEYTWEFPAGTVDCGETPEQAARRELLEEAGLEAGELVYLGSFHPDTGRIQVESHAYYGTARAVSHGSREEGLLVRLVDHAALKDMIVRGEFRHQVHLAIYAAVVARGIDLDTGGRR